MEMPAQGNHSSRYQDSAQDLSPAYRSLHVPMFLVLSKISALHLLSNLRVARCQGDVTTASVKGMYFEAEQAELLAEHLLRAARQMVGLAPGESHCPSKGSSA